MEQAASGVGATAAVLALLAGLLVSVAIGVKLYDLKRTREAEAVALQARISDALMREASVFDLRVTPTAHVPWWSGTPVRLELVGRVPSARERERVLRFVADEARAIRPDVTLVDRLEVDETAVAHVA